MRSVGGMATLHQGNLNQELSLQTKLTGRLTCCNDEDFFVSLPIRKPEDSGASLYKYWQGDNSYIMYIVSFLRPNGLSWLFDSFRKWAPNEKKH